MSRELIVQHEGKSYVWLGQWFEPQSHVTLPTGLANTLNALYSGQIRATEGEAELERLSQHVNDLLSAKQQGNPLVVRKAPIALLHAVDELRAKHAERPFPSPLIEGVRRLQDESGMAFLKAKDNDVTICWHCNQSGVRTVLDRRVDPECPACAWSICPTCAACRDPKFGDCDERRRRQSSA